MSLTSQLSVGELGHWCAEYLPGTRGVAAELGRTVSRRGRSPIRPRRPVERSHWAEIGGAFGQRLAFLVEPAPPYAALLGTVQAGIASAEWASEAHRMFPTHAQLGGEQARRALWLRPTPRGWWDLGEPNPDRISSGSATHETLCQDFVRRLADYLAEHALPGQLASSRGAEKGLARACSALAGWEDAHRSGQLPPALAALHYGNTDVSLAGLLNLADEDVLAELVELIALVQQSGTLNDWRERAGNPAPGTPLGRAAPAIVSRWADGDLLIGNDLVDVKTVIRLDDLERVERWLWQILAYYWLDTDNRWDIQNVGLYFARHGVHVRWGAATFADMLLGGTGYADDGARDDFLAVARRVITSEGGQAPGRWQRRPVKLADHIPDE